jgi:hypothetical protein
MTNRGGGPFTYRPGIRAERRRILNAKTEENCEGFYSAPPAETLRLDRPLLLSRVSHFAPMNANCAPLTARTARRLAGL